LSNESADCCCQIWRLHSHKWTAAARAAQDRQHLQKAIIGTMQIGSLSVAVIVFYPVLAMP